MAIPGFLKVKNDSVFFAGEGEFLLFIPEVYFDRQVAFVNGEYIETLGVLNYAIRKKPTDDISKNLKTFYFPSRFNTKPGSVEKVKNFHITNDCTADYRILTYRNNGIDEIIESIKVVEDISNVEDFVRLFVNTGNISKTIPYDKLHEYFLESIKLNGSSFNLPASFFGILVSELCRSPKNINKPFRLSKDCDENAYSYTPINITTVPKLVNAFTALTSQNFDEALVAAIGNDSDMRTPMQDIFTG